jgi:hypothetical protein
MMTVVEVAEITGKSPDWFYWRIRSGRPADEIAAGL